MTQAINAAAAVVQTFPTDDSDVVGDAVAIPARTRESTLVVAISFDNDPGASEYLIEGSLDGTNWVEIDTLNFIDDTPQGVTVSPCGFTFFRTTQVTKTNVVTTTVTAQLV